MLPNWLTKEFLSHDSHFCISEKIAYNMLSYELIFMNSWFDFPSDSVIINRIHKHLNFVCGKIWSQNCILIASVQTFKHTIFHNNEDPKDLSEDIKELASSSAEYFFKNKHICLDCPFVMCLVFCNKCT